jgi:very-short-patch-repair endonuclease
MPPTLPRTVRSRTLRRDQTDVERKLWAVLRGRQLSGFKFRRQHPKDRYFVDFVCLEAKLIVELDGGQHAEQVEYDARRSEVLEGAGFRVVRFWNLEVLEEFENVVETILRELELGRP